MRDSKRSRAGLTAAPIDSRRRGLLASLAGISLAAGASEAAVASTDPAGAGSLDGSRADFALTGSYLDGAFMHPISRASGEALKRYVGARLMDPSAGTIDIGASRQRALALFGAMVHAELDELAWIPSTMAGENAVVRGLGLPGTRQRVVTDEYHFHGSLYLYSELAKQGLDVHVVRARNHRILLEDLEKAITPQTRLVSLTLVSSVAGFEHDLKQVCEIAHGRGARVYADIIQAAGNTPIDLHASGVDFAACSTYKWLMGDFGLGFMYASRKSQQALRRTQWGYRQIDHDVTHRLPFDSPGKSVADFTPRRDLGGRVEVGTLGNGAALALEESLAYLQRLGVERIAEWRKPLIARLQQGMAELGYAPMTPAESNSPIVSFACQGARDKLEAKLKAAGIELTLYQNYLRVSLSFFNTLDDVERLLDVLSLPA